ncbi:MAG: aminopeptidase P family protein [Clostridia bacterium]|nr:aminopeptidase P family protein [Clostridia bacterium]
MNEMIQKVIANMEEEGLDQILVSSPSSLLYLAGIHVAPGERLCAMVIGTDGTCRLYGNRLFALSESGDYEVIEYDDTDDSVSVLEKGIKPGKLGIDKFWPGGFAVRLMEKRPDVRLVLGSAPVDEARMYKTPDEIRKMKASSLANDRAIEKTMYGLRLGETEADVADRYLKNAKAEGASGNSFDALICFGPNAAEPHHETGMDVLKTGDAVILDVGLLLDGYCSDMTRTCFMGGMTDEQKKVYDIVRKANAAGRAMAKPGIPLSEVDRAARDVITAEGYGEYFLHRTGHGIGLQVHEPPDVSASSKDIIIKPGMCFSVEPGVYLKGRFGVRIEDLVAITENGAETLNELPREPLIF